MVSGGGRGHAVPAHPRCTDRAGLRAITRGDRPAPSSSHKTGTVTIGTPDVAEIVTSSDLPPGELLRLAASVDRMSSHMLGEALVRGARERGLSLSVPTEVHEDPGQGIEGAVDARRVAVVAARSRGRPARRRPRVCTPSSLPPRTSWRSCAACGATVQEGIDLAVILNALRALRG